MRLSERETAAYCVVSGIDYLVEECPMAAGNKHLGYKEALNQIEAQSPGTKSDFYFRFLRQAAESFRWPRPRGPRPRAPASGAASPSTLEVCAFCRLVEPPRAAGGERPARAGDAVTDEPRSTDLTDGSRG